ncbi:uncharacterized protein ACIQIH_009024 [Cyanocitta cristata]
MVPGSPGTAAQGEAGGSSSRRGPARSEADGRYSPPRPQLISELPARAHHRAVRAPPPPPRAPPAAVASTNPPAPNNSRPSRGGGPGPAARSPRSSGGLKLPRAALPVPLAATEAGWAVGWVKRPRHIGGGGGTTLRIPPKSFGEFIFPGPVISVCYFTERENKTIVRRGRRRRDGPGLRQRPGAEHRYPRPAGGRRGLLQPARAVPAALRTHIVFYCQLGNKKNQAENKVKYISQLSYSERRRGNVMDRERADRIQTKAVTNV